jgi:hypothetical protein
MVFVPMLRTVFWIDKLPWINLYLELAAATFKGAIREHRDHFGIAMLERLIFYINILRFDLLLDAVRGLAMLRAVFCIRESEVFYCASRVQTSFFAQF